MIIDTNTMAPATEAGRNFSLVARTMERSSPVLDLTDDERVDIAAAHVLEKYKPAFEELAK